MPSSVTVAPHTFTARLRYDLTGGFAVTVFDRDVLASPGQVVPPGYYWLFDQGEEEQRVGYFLVGNNGAMGRAYIGPTSVPEDARDPARKLELERLGRQVRLTHSQRLDQKLAALEYVVRVLEGREGDVFNQPTHIFYGQSPEKFRQRFDEEIGQLEERGIEFLLHGLLDAPPRVLDYYGLPGNTDIREKIKRIWSLIAFKRRLAPSPS